jgi:hypothetical protein
VGLGNGYTGVNAYADYRFENSPLAFVLDARGTKFEAFRFHGFGNATPRAPRNLALVNQDLIAIQPALMWQIGWRSREELNPGFTKDDKVEAKLRPLVGKIEAGPLFLWNRAHPVSGAPFDAVGERDVARAGARLALELDRTSSSVPSGLGWTLRSEVAGYPPILDLSKRLTTAQAVAAVSVPISATGYHVALRAGGAAASGDVPVQNAPAIGGGSTVRGYSSRRYTGDRSAFGSAEVRAPVGTLPLFLKWKTGVFALADAGRVWMDGESLGGWHKGVGGGVWFAALGQTLSVAYAHGDENRFYLQKGLFF